MSVNTFQDGQLFRGVICDQILTSNANDEPQIVITVQIDAHVPNEQAPDSVVEMPAFERDVYLTVVDGSKKGEIARSQLRRLGVPGESILILHPEHSNHVSLIDKQVFVQCRVKAESTYWNLVWPRPKPKAITLKEAEELLHRPRQTPGLPNLGTETDGGSAGSNDGDTSTVSY